MKSLDYEYLGELLRMAQTGNTNAFAELYTATYSRQYEYAFRYLESVDLAKEALRIIYTRALKEIQTLQTPQLFMAWLNRISFQVCLEMQEKRNSSKADNVRLKIGAGTYNLNQMMHLPLTEAQVLIQFYYQKFSIKEIAHNLDISTASVKRYLRSGRFHLKKLLRA
jgi:RNA polymerase sigma-70 factor (ECF subfamily)